MVATVKFDPGIGELVIDFNEYVNSVYSQMMNFKTINQKKARFNLHVNKIEKHMEDMVAFYYGCLLWAYYITTLPKCDIVGNPFLGMSEEQKENYDYLIQVNFLENYFDSFERDVLYYTGKKKQISAKWREILCLYSEFLTLNKGFTNAKSNTDIYLPEKLKDLKININLKETIEKAISEQSLSSLLNVDILP